MADAQVSTSLHYRDPAGALAWLERAFGFETELLVTDADGEVVFARVAWEGGSLGVVSEAPPRALSPSGMGGANSQTITVRFEGDIDAHCAKARAAGAEVLREPRQEFYGDFTYLASDPEGHLWEFSQRVPEGGGPPPEGWSVRFPAREAEGAA
jgi:uncharacterized glyoxalase superfamily protein PhnB